jgi:ADP-heptose:LPS heptosyltransferase
MHYPTFAPKKILIIQLRQLGDILLTSPCIEEVKRAFPQARLSFLSHRMGKAILEKNPFLDQLITYHEQDSLALQWQRLAQLRRERFDLVIDFMNNPRSAIFSWWTGAARRISFRQRLGFAYTQLCPLQDDTQYIVQRKFSLLRLLGCTPHNTALLFPWQPEDLAPYHALAENNAAFRHSPLRVVLAPSHRRAVRKWPALRYVHLAERLVREWRASVTWIWGPGGEEQEIDALIAQCEVPTVKAPATTLPQLAALIAQHDIFIGNSNGPSHLAVAVDICSLQLHGHTNAEVWCPQNARHHSLQSQEFGLIPQATLVPISEESVWQKLSEMKTLILAQAQQRGSKA